jgi:YbgC/YbaW family acyl-CoA thioester hydrolase
MAGVMHFSNYLRWMEEVENEFFRHLGSSVMAEYGGVQTAWPRVSVRCRYFSPVRFEDLVDIHLTLIKIGNKSLVYQVEFVCAGRRVALGRADICCCRLQDREFKPMPIPESIRARMEEYLEAGDESP